MITVKRHPFAWEGNPLYPLPPDYETLSSLEAQRMARVAACSQWRLHSTPADKAAAAIASLRFFDYYYLRDDEETGFYPGFYDEVPAENALFHEDISAALVTHSKIVVAAPRGSAKSTHLRKEAMLRILSHPNFHITYATSSNRLAKRAGTLMGHQIESNSRINDDFSPECPNGRIKPPRGHLPFSAENFYLGNGSWVFTTSAESKNRGDRPHLFLLDDIEFDPSASTSMQLVRENTETLLFRIITPMLRKGANLLWVGTKISRRHFLHKAFEMQTSDSESLYAIDPRFDLWYRMDVKAEYVDRTGQRLSVWPAYWSLDWLDNRKAEIGLANYRSEYLNEPGIPEGTFFHINEGHEWWFKDVEPETIQNPRMSNAVMQWKRGEDLVETTLSEFLDKTPLFLTVDSSYTDSPTSDYKAFAVMGITPENELFVLDAWAARTTEPKLHMAVLERAFYWRAALICVETVKETYATYAALEHLLNTKLRGIMDEIGWRPRLKALKPGPQSKISKIAAMHFRFGEPDDNPAIHGARLIKYPRHLKKNSAVAMLYKQTEEFNPEADDGGLANDDILDCVAMHQQAIPGLPNRALKGAAAKTLEERMIDGELRDPATKTPYLHAIPLQDLKMSTIQQILARARDNDRANKEESFI